MSDNNKVDQRKYRRVNVNIPVKYREIDVDEIIVSGKSLKASECVNISRCGMQLLTDAKWDREEDQLVEAEFVMSGKVIRIIADIAWTGFDSQINKFRTGVEFIAIKSGDLEVIGQIA